MNTVKLGHTQELANSCLTVSGNSVPHKTQMGW